MHHQNKYFLATLALLVVPISGISIDIYVPSLPAVSLYFGVEKAFAQLSITTYIAGLGLMQLFAGGISDSFGRRKPFHIAMLIFILTSVLVPFSQNINQLLWLRFIQGAAVALTIVPMRSVVLDLFEGRELKKMMTYMTMAWSMGPIIAPAIGGYLQHLFGWQACFYFLAGYSVIIFILIWLYLPETSQHYHPFRIDQMIGRYRHILSHWNFVSGLLINGLIYSIIILFSIVAPFLIENVLLFSVVEFGHIALLMGLGLFLGTMTNRFLLDVPLYIKATVCFWTMLIISLVMFLMTFFYPVNIYNIVIPIFILIWISGIIYPNYFGQTISFFPKMTGSANALYGSLIFLAAGISSALGTLLKANNERPLAAAFILIVILCLATHYLDQRFEIKSKTRAMP